MQYEATKVMEDPLVAPFAALYPERAGVFAHDLSGHALLTLDALADAAAALDPVHVEIRHGDRGAGGDFAHLDAAVQCGDIIRNIADRRCWVMLRCAEHLPAYAALLADTLGQVRDMVEARTGPMHDPRAFIFISSLDMVTPFHCDPEYNILFQIAGDKSFRVFPAAAPFLNAADHEQLHVAGANMLAWNDGFADAGTEHRLGPGDALFVPYKAPHYVSVARGPSISLSLTWKSDWSFAQADAHRFNAAMRRVGLNPRPIPPWPARAPAKTIASKLLSRAGWPR